MNRSATPTVLLPQFSTGQNPDAVIIEDRFKLAQTAWRTSFRTSAGEHLKAGGCTVFQERTSDYLFGAKGKAVCHRMRL
jgi:hypothetical protein